MLPFIKPAIPAAIAFSALLCAAQAQAAPIALLSEDFDNVTGLASSVTTRTITEINTNNPAQLAGSPAPSVSNVGSGDASLSSFNVRREDNAINAESTAGFDGFFGAFPFLTPRNQFLVIGDDGGNFGGGGAVTGGPTPGPATPSSSTMSIGFALGAVPAAGLLDIAFRYVFDGQPQNTVTGAGPNQDDFFAELLLADNTSYSLLTVLTPSALTRGNFSLVGLDLSTLSAAPTYLNFTHFEDRLQGNSAVGLDNIRVTMNTGDVPEPGGLALVAAGLLALGAVGRRRA